MERSLTGILQASQNEIYIFDVDSLRFLHVTEGARNNLGYSMSELVGMTPLDLKPEFTPETFEKLIRPLRQGESNKIEFQTVHRRKDGSRYVLHSGDDDQDGAELALAGVIDAFLAPEGPTDPVAQSLVSQDLDSFLVIVELEPDLADDDAARAAVEEHLGTVAAELAAVAPQATGIVSSTPLIVSAVTDQVQADLIRGEAIAIPLSVAVMVIVFGGFLAAGVPLVGALASIAGGMGVLLVFAWAIELDAVVVNVITVLGLGLSIDYGLLIVSRFREEAAVLTASTESRGLPLRRRRRGASRTVVEQAVHRTVTTAGRTVTFSAVTIAIAISSLMVFSPDILRSLGAAGVSVVVIALGTSLTLVPALLVLLGARLRRRPVLARVPGLSRVLDRFGDIAPDDGVFSRLARGVHRHPWLVITGVVAIVLAVGFAFRTTRLLVRRIARLRQVAEALRAGNLTTRSDLRATDTEGARYREGVYIRLDEAELPAAASSSMSQPLYGTSRPTNAIRSGVLASPETRALNRAGSTAFSGM